MAKAKLTKAQRREQLTAELKATIIEKAAIGLPVSDIAEGIGISQQLVKQWIEEDTKFWRSLVGAKLEAKEYLLNVVRTALDSGHITVAALQQYQTFLDRDFMFQGDPTDL